MSILYCTFCDQHIDTDEARDYEWEPKFKCDACVEDDFDPTPDQESEPPITWLERASQYEPR